MMLSTVNADHSSFIMNDRQTDPLPCSLTDSILTVCVYETQTQFSVIMSSVFTDGRGSLSTEFQTAGLQLQ